ncbi:Asp23/Gls24 family envelope stress response protein [Fructobacillus parabroussonetiae]|uniref:Asp23/Gls24 family envelope stress response protein n=1 Tax=Fructobacillus parabroussonetiae TaxID=2713174 RepID=A0ABS5QXV1_9LACO|nr:Asp23/Gls24 family envelope stress response protein [Fructobacillus parabroussonetiae]MBS9337792.1 Asp23/Gls24 family envelope stress response protein [Fructobacillus parabroussonetiae]MCK8616784.1 Asp23/Gls24 family envelope stress response protein [Fructobacillus parabroussonetiae]
MAKSTDLTNKNFLLTKEQMADGQMLVSKAALEAVAKAAAQGVDGVVAMQAKVYDHLPKYLTKVTGVQPAVSGVMMKQDENQNISFDLAIILEYGAVIPKVAFAVQQAVKTDLANLAGLTVETVNVTVAGLVPDADHQNIDPEHLFDQSATKESAK